MAAVHINMSSVLVRFALIRVVSVQVLFLGNLYSVIYVANINMMQF